MKNINLFLCVIVVMGTNQYNNGSTKIKWTTREFILPVTGYGLSK